MNFADAVLSSQGIRHGAIGAAIVDHRNILHASPAVVKALVAETGVSTLAAETKVSLVEQEAAFIRDRQIKAAHQNHHDRCQAAAAHFGQRTDYPGSAGAAHAQEWLASIVGPVQAKSDGVLS